METTITNEMASRLVKGLEALSALDIQDFKTNYAIGRNIECLRRQTKAYLKSMGVIMKKYIAKDEKGAMLGTRTPSGEVAPNFLNEDDSSAYEKEKQELDSATVEGKIFMLKLSSIQNIVGLKGVILADLYELIEHDVEIMPTLTAVK